MVRSAGSSLDVPEGGRDEMWGTDTKAVAAPYQTVFAGTARLRIERISGPGGTVLPDGPHFDGAVAKQFTDSTSAPFAAAVNVAGDLSYRYDWKLNEWPGSAADEAGWWRLTFTLDPSATYMLPGADGRQTSRTIVRNAVFAAADPNDAADGHRFRPQLADPYTEISVSVPSFFPTEARK